ncbi:hypothetical protein J6590_092181 [Homalodisca vitripennis]|nr:hypothetical protein J6590_092181 [Homalodisca vitripennis]
MPTVYVKFRRDLGDRIYVRTNYSKVGKHQQQCQTETNGANMWRTTSSADFSNFRAFSNVQ